MFSKLMFHRFRLYKCVAKSRNINKKSLNKIDDDTSVQNSSKCAVQWNQNMTLCHQGLRVFFAIYKMSLAHYVMYFLTISKYIRMN